MNPIRPFAAALALLCIVPLTHTQAKAEAPKPSQRVILHFPSHTPQSTEHEQTYAATCKDIAYRLVVTPGSKSVVLKADTLNDVDLSRTLVARQLLDRDVITKVGFNCPMNALNIFLQGFITEELAMPKAYKTVVSVRRDGTVRGEEALRMVAMDEFGSPRELKEKAAPARN